MSYMLIDLNQVLISNLMQHLKFVTKQHEMSEDLIRHMCLCRMWEIAKSPTDLENMVD